MVGLSPKGDRTDGRSWPFLLLRDSVDLSDVGGVGRGDLDVVKVTLSRRTASSDLRSPRTKY